MRVVPVEGRRGVSRFIDVPWRIFDGRRFPQWVPPLRAQVAELLDARRHPFYRRAARRLFLAEDGKRVLGRIAAIDNQAHNDFHRERVGFFGFFECVDDNEVAASLIEAAAAWLAERGLEAVRGPMSPSTNYDCGMLVDGFDVRPTFLTTWNPPYYPALMERAGLTAVKELVSYFLALGEIVVPPALERLSARAARRSRVDFRNVDLRHFRHEVECFWKVYGAAWEENWGFVPVTREEFHHMAKDLQYLLVEEFGIVAEVDGEPVGFVIAVPDYNETLARIGNGRLFPTGLFRLLAAKRRLRVGRVMVLGIHPEYRRIGILPLLFHELIRRGAEYGGIGVDASWILADNQAMRAPLDQLGAPVTRRWRIYQRGIARRTRAGGTRRDAPPEG